MADVPYAVLLAEALVSFVLALALGLYATPVAREAALRFGIVDRPDGNLKTHGTPVPYFGGLAIYAAFLLSTSLSLTLGFDGKVLGLLLGGSILVIVGLIDDLGTLPYGAKFFGEIVAALVAIRSGIVIELHYGPPGLELVGNALLSLFWLVLVTNAVNIIDIMDGLAGSVSFVASACLALVALLNGRSEVLCITAALAGATLAFLKDNRHPARIYMGDTGALFLGFMLGALCLIGSYTRLAPLGFLSPLYVLAVPLFDTAFVSVLRLSRGASPFRGSPDHFAIRLRRSGRPVPAVVRIAALCGVATGGLGLANVFLARPQAIALAGAALFGVLGAAVVLLKLPDRTASTP
ncbi:MAG: MraY family glycosyltransferase [Acidobacteriota bacterium]